MSQEMSQEMLGECYTESGDSERSSSSDLFTIQGDIDDISGGEIKEVQARDVEGYWRVAKNREELMIWLEEIKPQIKAQMAANELFSNFSKTYRKYLVNSEKSVDDLKKMDSDKIRCLVSQNARDAVGKGVDFNELLNMDLSKLLIVVSDDAHKVYYHFNWGNPDSMKEVVDYLVNNINSPDKLSCLAFLLQTFNKDNSIIGKDFLELIKPWVVNQDCAVNVIDIISNIEDCLIPNRSEISQVISEYGIEHATKTLKSMDFDKLKGKDAVSLTFVDRAKNLIENL